MILVCPFHALTGVNKHLFTMQKNFAINITKQYLIIKYGTMFFRNEVTMSIFLKTNIHIWS